MLTSFLNVQGLRSRRGSLRVMLLSLPSLDKLVFLQPPLLLLMSPSLPPVPRSSRSARLSMRPLRIPKTLPKILILPPPPTSLRVISQTRRRRPLLRRRRRKPQLRRRSQSRAGDVLRRWLRRRSLHLRKKSKASPPKTPLMAVTALVSFPSIRTSKSGWTILTVSQAVRLKTISRDCILTSTGVLEPLRLRLHRMSFGCMMVCLSA